MEEEVALVEGYTLDRPSPQRPQAPKPPYGCVQCWGGRDIPVDGYYVGDTIYCNRCLRGYKLHQAPDSPPILYWKKYRRANKTDRIGPF